MRKILIHNMLARLSYGILGNIIFLKFNFRLLAREWDVTA